MELRGEVRSMAAALRVTEESLASTKKELEVAQADNSWLKFHAHCIPLIKKIRALNIDPQELYDGALDRNLPPEAWGEYVFGVVNAANSAAGLSDDEDLSDDDDSDDDEGVGDGYESREDERRGGQVRYVGRAELLRSPGGHNTSLEGHIKDAWVPDAMVKKCTHCSAKFTFFRRRHHCRWCLNIFCASCSSTFMSIPQLNHIEPVRVCDTCTYLINPNILSP